MVGWLLVLSFVLGFALTWLYMVRSVSRTVDPVSSSGGVREIGDDTDDTDDTEVIEVAGRRDHDEGRSPAGLHGRRTVVPQVVEFDDDPEFFTR